MRDVPIVDQPRWPAIDSLATPARMTFKMVWKSTGEPVLYDDPARQFRFSGFRASCQLEAQVAVPSEGFLWKSDPLEKSHADFAIIGEEVNGRYYKEAGLHHAGAGAPGEASMMGSMRREASMSPATNAACNGSVAHAFENERSVKYPVFWNWKRTI